MSKTGDQLQAEAHAPTKAKADAARAKVRDTHASRSARARSNPEAAKVVDAVCADLDEVKPPKDKGGRPKGSKNKSPEAVCRDRIFRTINRKGEKWLAKLADDETYLFLQLVKRVLPGTAPMASAPDNEQHTIRVRYGSPPLPTEDRKYAIEYDTPDGKPMGGASLRSHDGTLPAPNSPLEIVPMTQDEYDSCLPDPHPIAPDEPAPKTSGEQTTQTGYDAMKLTAESVYDAAMEGIPGPERSKLRTLIVEAGRKFNAQLHTKFVRQTAELKKLRKAQSYDSRMRMYGANAGPDEGWGGSGGENW